VVTLSDRQEDYKGRQNITAMLCLCGKQGKERKGIDKDKEFLVQNQ